MRNLSHLGWAVAYGLWAASAVEAGVGANLLANPSFEKSLDARGTPLGWQVYGQCDGTRRLSLVEIASGGSRSLRIEDGSDRGEIGVMQTVPAEPNQVYRASVRVCQAGSADSKGSYLQMRFLPSGAFRQKPLGGKGCKGFRQVQVTGTAPPGTRQITLYLYTHAQPTPCLIVDEAELVSGADPNEADDVPPPVSPVYATVSDLHLTTQLVRDGRPAVSIVVPASGQYDAAAARIREAIRVITGVPVATADDEATAARIRAAVVEGFPAIRPADGRGPLPGNVICLGNRSTNRTIGALYDLYYCLTDLKYPGPGGHEVRTVHSAFGDGMNVILAGGSDAAGVESAADVLIGKLKQAGGGSGRLEIGRLMEIRLSGQYTVPTDIRAVQTWEASDMYGSSGYFGWNLISKRMALYYMTGDEVHAREAMRLALPDAAAKQEIADIDGEMVENKDAPLSGPYHYNAHMMILFWDLIEESPVFSEEQRLRVINAFSQQLQHRKSEGIYGTTLPPAMLGSRHGQWSAVSLYCLGRYFQASYPAPVWRHCVESARTHFEALHDSAWIMGELDNLYWYNTGIAPIFTYLVLTGDRRPIENGVVPQLLRGQEMLISGRVPDWALRGASLDFLHKAAYVTGDGRWITYRRRTRNDVDVFRIGQSFWPAESLRPAEPRDLAGAWSVHPLPEPAWRERRSGIPHDESFYFASFRSEADDRGDFILLDGFNGASRNPYHTFAILELRLGGRPVLQGRGADSQGYLNQVLTRCDGMVEPRVAMDAALRHRDVLGQTAVAVAEVPNAAFCDWRRSVVQRVGRYALIVDDLTFGVDSENMEVETLWEGQGFRLDGAGRGVRVQPGSSGSAGASILGCDRLEGRVEGGVASFVWNGAAGRGRHRVAFWLIAPEGGGSSACGCGRLAERAASLSMPVRALAVAGQYEGIEGDLVILGEDHLFGFNLRRAGLDGSVLETDAPVDVDWDFTSGRLFVRTAKDTRIRLGGGDSRTLELKAGTQVIDPARPTASAVATLGRRLGELAERVRSTREQSGAAGEGASASRVRQIEPVWTAQLSGRVTALEAGKAAGEDVLYTSVGKAIYGVGEGGKVIRTLEADGVVRSLRWWPEHGLLLAGCVDEKVIAFDSSDGRRWTFVSQMDPAVFAAAKQYWFKSAHPGVFGLHTGVFIDGKSQAFVGSACTLEIVDENGGLVRRMPVFWGPGNVFQIVDAPDGSRNLLVGRRPNDGHALAIINCRTLSPGSRGFDGVPAGHTYVGGWDGMSRHHLFYDDLDGDGRKEVVSEITGVWNRVTVWSTEGKPLYNAQFGPGPDHHQPDRTLRDLAVADLNGDGRKEIVVATRRGLVVALTGHCEKVWSKRLPSAPVVLLPVERKGGGALRVFVSCEDGSLAVLDGAGSLVCRGAVAGRPVCVAAIDGGAEGPLAVVATERGQLRAFRGGEGLAK
jgi:hypothetical protein